MSNNKLLPACLPIHHDLVFKKLLDQIEGTDFHKAGKLNPKTTLTNTDYRIIIIEYLKHKSKQNNWGLCQSNDDVYLYNGAYWKKIDQAKVKDFLGRVSAKMGLKWQKSKDFKFKEELYKQFISAGYINKLDQSLDSGVRINLQNGTYYVGEGKNELRGFESSDFMKYQLPFYYDPNATCPTFDNFLNEVLPDPSSRMVLAEFVASTFIRSGTLKLEKALILHGSGANGKSVFFEVIMALLGKDNVCSFSLASLTSENGYARAELVNKFLNYVSEIHGKMKSDIFKQLASGEPIEARSPYGKPHIIEEYAKFIFNCNELPSEVEQTEAFFRRFIIIPFDVVIPEHKQNKELAKGIINTELSGVFNWILLGLGRILTHKNYSRCEASNSKVLEYKKQSNSVLLFIDDLEYISSVNDSIKLKDLYTEYSDYCRDNGHRAIANNLFSDRLKKAGFEVVRSSSGRIVYASKKVPDIVAQMT